MNNRTNEPTFGMRLHAFRMRRGTSSATLARKLDARGWALGRGGVRRIERGMLRPRATGAFLDDVTECLALAKEEADELARLLAREYLTTIFGPMWFAERRSVEWVIRLFGDDP